MKKTVMTLLALVCLLSGMRNSLARHCELVGWSKDETRAILWCQQGCSKDSCLPFERLDVLGPSGIEKSFEILETGNSSDQSPADQAALRRATRMEAALADLRAQGFSIPDVSFARFSSGRIDPQRAQSPVFAVTKATHALGQVDGCRDWSGLIGRYSQFLMPIDLPCRPGSEETQTSQLMLVVDQCQPDANLQASLHFSIKIGVLAKGWSFTVGDLTARFGSLSLPVAPGGRIEVSHVISPKRHAVLIQVEWLSQESFYTSDSLLSLDRPPTDRIFSLCAPLPPPAAQAQPRSIGQQLSRYFRMPDASFGGYMLTGGAVATGNLGMSVSGFDFVFFFNDNPALGFGLAFGVFSYQIWDKGDVANVGEEGWALLDLGPAVRVGRLVMASKASLISFEGANKNWMPGIRNRLMFPLVTHQEWPFWSSLIPAPTVGYDLWFDDRLRLDHHGLFLGFSFIGNFTERTPMDGPKN